MTLAAIEGGGGQWMPTISTPDRTPLSRSSRHLIQSDAHRIAHRIVDGFGAGTAPG